MSIATDVSRIKGNITAALAAIADKGVTVPDGSTSDALAGLIASIEAGGAQLYETDITPAVDVSSSDSSTWITISHNLGAIPRIVIITRVSLIGSVQYESYFSITYNINSASKSYSVQVYHNSSTALASETNSKPAVVVSNSQTTDIGNEYRANVSKVNTSTLDLVGQANNSQKRLKAGSTYHVVVIA